MVIVSDTGPMLHLSEADSLELVHLAGAVHIPAAVGTELGRYAPVWHSPEWLVMDELIEPYAIEANAWRQAGLLDLGEAEAIALARQLRSNWLLTDDAAARLMAQALGLEVHGSLGVVLWAASMGHLKRTQAQDTLENLAHSSIWISPKILLEARAVLSKL